MSEYEEKLKQYLSENNIDAEFLDLGRSCHTVQDAADSVGADVDEWCRMAANMNAGRYDLFLAKSVTIEPSWPEMEMSEILNLAFGESKVVQDIDHVLVRQLLGLE